MDILIQQACLFEIQRLWLPTTEPMRPNTAWIAPHFPGNGRAGARLPRPNPLRKLRVPQRFTSGLTGLNYHDKHAWPARQINANF